MNHYLIIKGSINIILIADNVGFGIIVIIAKITKLVKII